MDFLLTIFQTPWIMGLLGGLIGVGLLLLTIFGLLPWNPFGAK